MQKPNSVKFAASSVKITPPLGTGLSGYFTERKADGVHDDLYAKILYLEKDSANVMIIACDLIGVPAEFAYPLRKQISGRTGIPVPSIMVCATHTHTGPVMRGDKADNGCLARIREDIADSAAGLPASAREGFLEYGSSTLSGYAFNRRYVMKDGSVLTNPGADNPDVVKPAGPVDESVNVIQLKNSAGEVGAVCVNAGLHPDTVSGSKISADWPGRLSKRVMDEFGADVPVLVINGTQGDINHFDVMGGRVEQSIEEAERIGSAYGKKVVEICRDAGSVKVDKLDSRFELAVVPRRRISGEDLKAAEETVRKYGDEYDIEKSGRMLESQDIARGDIAVRVFFAKNMISFNEKYKGTSVELEMSALRIGEIAFLGVGGELFTEIGLAIKEESPFKHTLIAVLANGYNGYLVSAGAFKGGGYETMPRDTSQFGEEAEGIIRKTALKMLGELRRD